MFWLVFSWKYLLIKITEKKMTGHKYTKGLVPHRIRIPIFLYPQSNGDNYLWNERVRLNSPSLSGGYYLSLFSTVVDFKSKKLPLSSCTRITCTVFPSMYRIHMEGRYKKGSIYKRGRMFISLVSKLFTRRKWIQCLGYVLPSLYVYIRYD